LSSTSVRFDKCINYCPALASGCLSYRSLFRRRVGEVEDVGGESKEIESVEEVEEVEKVEEVEGSRGREFEGVFEEA
jgi:hypothetical protein